MPAAKYDGIYRDLKNKIESEQYEFQELLPSENQLVEVYGCSRNTVRRAIAGLVTDGYVQTVQGKGVRNIYRILPGIFHPQPAGGPHEGSPVHRTHCRPENRAQYRFRARHSAFLYPAGALPEWKGTDPQPQLLFKKYYARSDQGNCRTFHLRISGKDAARNDREQPESHDRRKGHGNR